MAISRRRSSTFAIDSAGANIAISHINARARASARTSNETTPDLETLLASSTSSGTKSSSSSTTCCMYFPRT